MKKWTTLLVLLISSTVLYSQDEAQLYVLETPTTWKTELFTFPIGFAQDIAYEGFEDARFPEGWNKENNLNFWSYVFAWSINSNKELTENELETNLQLYFDGLMNAKGCTTALFVKKINSVGVSKFIGKIKTTDAFFTKKPLTFNVVVDTYYCQLQKKLILIFRFSPKAFESSVWNTLKEVKLRADSCKS